MSKPKQDKKIKEWIDLGVRGTPTENEFILAAASLKRQSRCQFILSAALDSAKSVIAETPTDEPILVSTKLRKSTR